MNCISFVSLWVLFIGFVSSDMIDNSSVTYVEKNLQNDCHCEKFECECCVDLVFPDISLNSKGCVHVAYLSEDYGVSISLNVDETRLLKESVSVRNPPPICLGIPFVKKHVLACVELNDLSVSKSSLQYLRNFHSSSAQLVPRRKRDLETIKMRLNELLQMFPFNICSSESSLNMPNNALIAVIVIFLCTFVFHPKRDCLLVNM
ncbi:DUF4773 domain-containing protein [Trichonephila inaurata madagascariensis]|uniref:DUF4773 domain-containing protein n=1 Tax=Trichonephila inaurata madagascariensis TaxID=2747483 RepID=A0A8X7C9C5_9ARAC|nr:DUF4773 domain-containing protein [Trichonephila inaurata madagascariensis]